MTFDIRIQNTVDALLDETRLRRAARTVLEKNLAGGRARLTIVVTDAAALRQLNRSYRKIDAATDVLSFAAPTLPDEIDASDGYLGDVILAYDYVALRAAKRGTSLADTLSLLVVHGALHLLGYSHDTDSSFERMWIAQEQALAALGIDSSVVQAYETVKHA